MTWVTRKGLIITREQYKKMCGSVELSKGIASSYLVKFQMTFHTTAKPETILTPPPLPYEPLQPLRVIMSRAEIPHCNALVLALSAASVPTLSRTEGKRQESDFFLKNQCRLQRFLEQNMQMSYKYVNKILKLYELACLLLILTSNWLTVYIYKVVLFFAFSITHGGQLLMALYIVPAQRKWRGKHAHFAFFCFFIWLPICTVLTIRWIIWPNIRYSNYTRYTVFFSSAWWICTHLMCAVYCCLTDSEFAL